MKAIVQDEYGVPEDVLELQETDEDTMKAVAQDEYGSPDVLEFTDVDMPAINDDEVLVRVHAAAVNPGDWHLMRGLPYLMRLFGSGMGFGLHKPRKRVGGMDVAGRVEAVGKNVTQLRAGDEVYGESPGPFAEYLCASEDLLAPKPANLTFDRQPRCPSRQHRAPGSSRHRTDPARAEGLDQRCGWRGGIVRGAARQGVRSRPDGSVQHDKVAMVRSIGADRVIDYTLEDFTQSGQRYDLIFDLAGNRSLSDCRGALTPKGTLVLSSGNGGWWFGPAGRFVRALVLSPFVGQRLRPLAATPSRTSFS